MNTEKPFSLFDKADLKDKQCSESLRADSSMNNNPFKLFVLGVCLNAPSLRYLSPGKLVCVTPHAHTQPARSAE